MATLTALMLTAPLFGMTLNIDAAVLEAPAVMVDPGVFLALEVSTELEEPKGPTTAELLQKRNKIKKVHKWLGITTWSLMTLSVV